MHRKVSFYIPAYNVEKFIGPCIETIMQQSYPVSEIIIIDDGSKDRTVEIAQKYPVKIVRHDNNRGLAAVRNTGVINAQFDYIGSVDADCLPEPDWLERLMKHFDLGNIAGVSGKLIEKYQSKMPDRWRAIHMKQYWEGTELIINPMHLFGNNTVFYRPALADVGYYKDSPEYRTNNEDYYISRCLLEKNYSIIYDPDALVYHLRQDSCSSLFRTYWRWFFLHRPRPDSKRGLYEKAKVNLQYFKYFLKQDLIAGNWNLIPVNFAFLYFQSLHDFRFALAERRKRHSKIHSNIIH